MDLDAMKVIVNILERDIPLVDIGTQAAITVDAFPGKEFTGSVTRYSQAVDPATRTMAVEIDIPNHDHLLKPGMFANVTLVTEEHPNAMTLPTMAILKDDQGPFVFTAVADTARKRRVKTGNDQGDKTEILSGISDSDRVITTGQQFVKDGGVITIQS
jgi:RND family efflux transporter MFP subunit